MNNRKIQKIVIDNYDLIKQILNGYKQDEIGIHEAMSCMCGMIENVLLKLNKYIKKELKGLNK